MLLIKRNGYKTGTDNSKKACFGNTTIFFRESGDWEFFSGKYDVFLGYCRTEKRSLRYFRECHRKIREDLPNFQDGFKLHTVLLKQRLLQL